MTVHQEAGPSEPLLPPSKGRSSGTRPSARGKGKSRSSIQRHGSSGSGSLTPPPALEQGSSSTSGYRKLHTRDATSAPPSRRERGRPKGRQTKKHPLPPRSSITPPPTPLSLALQVPTSSIPKDAVPDQETASNPLKRKRGRPKGGGEVRTKVQAGDQTLPSLSLPPQRSSSTVLAPLSPEHLLAGSSSSTLVDNLGDVKGVLNKGDEETDGEEEEDDCETLGNGEWDQMWRLAVEGKLQITRDSPSKASDKAIEQIERKEPVRQPTQLPVGVSIGDPCFVRDGHSESFYLNGYLKDFHPATAENWAAGDRYEVVHRLKSKPIKVRRAQVIFMTDKKEFATCKRRELKVDYPDLFCDADTRSPSPTPSLIDPPMSSQSFRELPFVEQLRTIRPHLQAVISESYLPALPRIELFFKRQQHDLDKMVKMGNISEEVQQQIILPELKRWALRAERWDGMPGHEDRNHELARPIGSERYESLRPRDRLQYVMSVLMPEASVQLCLIAHDIVRDNAQQAYDEAIEILGKENTHDDRAQWAVRAATLNAARKRLRKELGEEEEDLSEYHKMRKVELEFNDQMGKTIKFSQFTGRERKIIDYSYNKR